MDAFGAYSDSEEDAGEETEAPKPLALQVREHAGECAVAHERLRAVCASWWWAFACLMRALSQDEDSGVEDEDEAGAGSAAKDATAAAIAAVQAAADASKAAPKRKLPSALDALSTGGTKPSFLQGGNDSEFEVVELKERRLAPQDPEDGPPPLAPPLKKPRDASTAQVRTHNARKLTGDAPAGRRRMRREIPDASICVPRLLLLPLSTVNPPVRRSRHLRHRLAPQRVALRATCVAPTNTTTTEIRPRLLQRRKNMSMSKRRSRRRG